MASSTVVCTSSLRSIVSAPYGTVRKKSNAIRGDDARGDARPAATDDRDPEHDEHQDQGEVRRCDMAAQWDERADSGDRDQRRASDTDHHSTMYERATIGSRLLTRS